jgi:hypothetical protein
LSLHRAGRKKTKPKARSGRSKKSQNQKWGGEEGETKRPLFSASNGIKNHLIKREQNKWKKKGKGER